MPLLLQHDISHSLLLLKSLLSICINSGLPSANTPHHIDSRSTRKDSLEVFREILNICPKVPGKEFDEPSTKEEALSFIRELGHSGEIGYITDIIVDHLHQPWRTFTSIINKCLCGKVSGLDKIRLLRVQILWGMYYKKNLDFVDLIWEDLAYQIDNIDSNKQDKMF
ncbi:hypothetical protein Tco_1263267 [Tanacetum coccineum]